MRQDKMTTKLQEALSDSQSLAVGNDNQYIEPVHLLTALLNQDDGGARSWCQLPGNGEVARWSHQFGTRGDAPPGSGHDVVDVKAQDVAVIDAQVFHFSGGCQKHSETTAKQTANGWGSG